MAVVGVFGDCSTDKCGSCRHPRSLHVGGHECAGTFYEGGQTCPCDAYDRTSCIHGRPSCEECVAHDTMLAMSS